VGADDRKIIEHLRELLHFFKFDDFQVENGYLRFLAQQKGSQFHGALGHCDLGKMGVEVFG
jgi:hypothetical protein